MNKAENYTSIIMEQVSNETSSKDAEKIRNKMLLAAKIEDALKAKGWKKLDLANRLNKKPSVITKWISGTHNFTTETLWDIEKLLGINLINITNHKNKDIGFSLKGIEILEIQINHPERSIPENTVFNFEVEIKHRFNIENQLIFVICCVSILIDDDLKVGFAKINCIFSLTDFETLIKDKNNVDIPKKTAIALNSISISTIRGILFSELKGTFLHHAVLPIVDPANFKQQNNNG